jgi:serine protease AprX
MRRLMTLVLVTVVMFALVISPGLIFGKSGPPKSIDENVNRIDDDLEARLDTLQIDEKIPVIAIFAETGFEVGKFHSLSENALKAVEARAGKLETKYKYENIPARALNLTKEQILALAQEPSLVKLQLDGEVHAFLGTASTYFGAAKARTDFGVTGNLDGNPTVYSKTDIVVAVIDTGIDTGHVDLDGGKVIAWEDWVNHRTAPYDDNGHGSHVSGIIAGTGEGNASYKGVAPGAALIGLKVLNSSGSGSISNVDAAIEWVITNKSLYNIRVINLSLGTTGSSNGNDSTSQLVNKAFANGIVPVVAAGNDGPNFYTIGSPGAAANAITVGAQADPGEKGFFQAYFSSRGPTADGRIKPDVSAPGYNITSVRAGTSSSYTTYSGTSMATPFVAGTVALLLSANSSLTPTEIKSKLTSTTVDWGAAGQDSDYGYGRLQAYEAVKSAGGWSGVGPVVPQHSYFTGSLSGTGQNYYHSFSVTSTASPIAITFLQNSSNVDFDIYLISPSGTQVASATGILRQETLTYQPTVTGTYQLRVYSYAGSGGYSFDLSDN